MKSRFRFLGSGTSQGVPVIGCSCKVCCSLDPKDKRLRSSGWLYCDDFSLLIDTSPDFRTQALRAKIQKVDAVLYTHAHADHVLGMDDLRSFCEMYDREMPIYSHPETLHQIQTVFPYAFSPQIRIKTYVRVVPHPVQETFSLGAWEITPLPVTHGKIQTYGYLFCEKGIKKLAYFSDCKVIAPEVIDQIRGVKYFVIDGLRQKPHPTHLSHAEALEMARLVAADQTYFTHLTHHESHQERSANVPSGVQIAYDELEIEL